MSERRVENDHERYAGTERPAVDDSELSEGIGGVPDLDPDERATVSDVDGDNVETERPKPQL